MQENRGDSVELISRAKALEREALEEIFRLHYEKIYRYAYFKLGSVEDAESMAWFIEGRSMRASALGRVVEARGPLDRAEAARWTNQVQTYDDYPLVYSALRNLRAHLDSLKGEAPRSVFAGLASAADLLESGIESVAATEKEWQEKRAAKK